jgi:hypothetical protein
MKLFEGFHAFGFEVRWIPASPARGRPEGFWQQTGHSVEFFYTETMLWFGGPGGLSRVAISHRDQGGTKILKPCPGPTWEGTQAQQKDKGDPVWEDYWNMESSTPGDLEVEHGPIKVMWQTFDSTWSAYMKSMEDGLYAERSKVVQGIQYPLIEDKGCYEVGVKAIWS